MAGDRAAGRFGLPRGEPRRLHRLQTHRTKVQRGAALGVAMDAALMGFAKLCSFRLQHFLSPSDRESPRSGDADMVVRPYRAGRTPDVCASTKIGRASCRERGGKYV